MRFAYFTMLMCAGFCIGQGKPAIFTGSLQAQNVHCGLQDRSGNLWFGTTGAGVYRYDGEVFKHFTTNDGLSSNTVFAVLEDENGRIWFGTSEGISRYDHNIITRFAIVYGNELLNPETYSLMQDRMGKIWLGTNRGVFLYNGAAFTALLDNPQIVNKNLVTLTGVQCMLEDGKGNIWLGSGPMAFEGVCIYDGKSITTFKPGGEGWVRHIAEDTKGTIWLANRHSGISTYDGKAFSKFEAAGRGDFASVVNDHNGNVWYAAWDTNGKDGVWQYDGKNLKNFTPKDGLYHNDVYCIIEDRTGKLWFGSKGLGLSVYDGTKFTNFTL